MFIVAFDCDGTLIDYLGNPRLEIINLLNAFNQIKDCHVIVWSGGGILYAEGIVNKLKLSNVTVKAKGQFKVDLAIDDQYVNLGLANLRTNPIGE